MPPRIPWMTFSPMRKKKTQAMAVSLSLEWEGEEGQQEPGQLCPLPQPPDKGCSPSRNRFSFFLWRWGRDLAGTLISSASPSFLTHQHLVKHLTCARYCARH